jgi:hypothetical protein
VLRLIVPLMLLVACDAFSAGVPTATPRPDMPDMRTYVHPGNKHYALDTPRAKTKTARGQQLHGHGDQGAKYWPKKIMTRSLIKFKSVRRSSPGPGPIRGLGWAGCGCGPWWSEGPNLAPGPAGPLDSVAGDPGRHWGCVLCPPPPPPYRWLPAGG